ncbi:MAG: 4Fe-4S dicluster domain-containing protein [Bacteriovoracaceae bacterium]|nr:4Fe-4S dicluster domain-containing protein [Bacteriovoracaceae bacterium]
MNEATREILWNIPYSYKVCMYAFLLIATLFFIKGFYTKYLFVTNKKTLKIKDLFPKNFNFKNFFKTILLQGKIPRKPHVGFFHALIYYGFIVLWIATDLVAIHYDTPFKIFQGTTYKVISFLADLAGLLMLIGIGFAWKRRYIDRPSTLSSTKPQQEKLMYFMLLNLVLVGFLLEGLRILGTGMPIGEATWAPIGWFLANGLKALNLSDTFLSSTYRLFWFLHMTSTMIFIVMLAYSKFSHILLLPLSSLLHTPRKGAVLNPMNFENENAESFGLGKISELTIRERFDMLTCVECGRCTEVCPAQLAGKPLDPKKIVTKMRDFSFSDKAHESIWDHALYANSELDACTTCGACMEECPAHIEHIPIIMDLKRYKALTLGELPASAADTVNKIKLQGNPWGISKEDRFKWSEGLDIPVIKENIKVDYLYYVGCAGSYDASNQKVVKDTTALLKKAQVSFAVMGKGEKCNGDPIRRFGDEYSFQEIAIENISQINRYTFNKIVTHCPHCLHTLGKEYSKFEAGHYTVIHHTELLAELIREKKLVPEKAINEEMTYHDPCYLGRHHGEYDAPRDILHSIPHLQLKEMDKNKDKALCCGMGGGNMWYEIPEGGHLVENRLTHIGETQTSKLATACSYCMINFNSSKGKQKETENLEIQDIASILAKSIF